MPTYEFKCSHKVHRTVDGDEHIETITRSIKDNTPVLCTVCESEMTQLIPTTTSFKLKGSSWAKDGYR